MPPSDKQGIKSYHNLCFKNFYFCICISLKTYINQSLFSGLIFLTEVHTNHRYKDKDD